MSLKKFLFILFGSLLLYEGHSVVVVHGLFIAVAFLVEYGL